MVKVLDASALVLLFEAKPGYELVRQLFIQAATGKNEILMTAVNWGEARYSLINKLKDVSKVKKALDALPIKIIEVDTHIASLAGDFKLKYKMGYCDAMAAAAASIYHAECVTSDSGFNVLSGVIKVMYIKV